MIAHFVVALAVLLCVVLQADAYQIGVGIYDMTGPSVGRITKAIPRVHILMNDMLVPACTRNRSVASIPSATRLATE
jgi:hypothetical protein